MTQDKQCGQSGADQETFIKAAYRYDRRYAWFTTLGGILALGFVAATARWGDLTTFGVLNQLDVVFGLLVIGVLGLALFMMGLIRFAVIRDIRMRWLHDDSVQQDAFVSAFTAMGMAIVGAIMLSAVPLIEVHSATLAKSVGLLGDYSLKLGIAVFGVYKAVLLGGRFLVERKRRREPGASDFGQK